MTIDGGFTRRTLLVASAAAARDAGPASMPMVPFGPHKLSKLIVGGNPVSGHSHISDAANREMIDYFTAANAKKMLAECERAGITAWQSRGDRHIVRLLHEFRQEGGRLDWIAQTATEMASIPAHIRGIAGAGKPIAIYNHGSNTDNLWRAGKIGTVRDQCKAMRDTGALVGVGTHIPEVVEHVESAGWDVDFFMTCLYNLSRTGEEASKLAGRAIEGEYFRHEDREQMLERVKASRKQCLIFKVYGAGRQCGSAASRLDAIKLAFRYAKPSDAIVVGMFPKRTEQVRENCGFVREALRSLAASG